MCLQGQWRYRKYNAANDSKANGEAGMGSSGGPG